MRPSTFGALPTAVTASLLGLWASPARAESWADHSDGAEARRADTSRDSGPRDTEEKKSSRTDHVRVGAIGGLGFPRFFAIEGMVKLERTVGLGLEYSVLPTLTISGVETRFHALAADVRLFPFQNAFFVGVRGGRQTLDAHGTVTVSGYGTTTQSVRVETPFVNPRIGFLWTFDPGVTIGIDAGVQIPLGTTSSNSLPDGSVASAEVNRVATDYGNKVLPTIDILRLGFLL